MKSHKRFNGDKAAFLSSGFSGIPRHVRRFVKFSFTGCQQKRVVRIDFSLLKILKTLENTGFLII